MINVKYDSKNEIYKKPFGALKTSEKVHFSIYVSSDKPILDVRLIYRHDADDKSLPVSMKNEGADEEYTIFGADISFDTPDLYFYRFEAETCDGIHFIGSKDGVASVEDWLPEWQLTVYDKDFSTPDWAKGAIMYQIFPDRFAKSESFTPLPAKNERKIHSDWSDIPDFIYDNPDYKANDYFCGNIDGVIEKLDYIKSLGVSIIYFNPVFESPEYHRYSTGNYLNIDPYFGTNEKFKELCEKCQKKGIKVILDGVFSHTGADSIYFNKYSNYDSVGAYNSKESPFYNWYTFSEYPDKYESWWGFENLPNVKETHPEYLEYITGKSGVINYWQSLGASGWRLDVADELPDEFLDSLYKRAKETDKDAFIIGEVWEDATNKFAYGIRRRYLLGGQMDSVMNYPFREAILDFIKYSDEKLFHERIMSILENYPPQVIDCLMNSISTHDTVRAITHFGVEKNVPDEEKGRYVMTEEEYRKGKNSLLLATFLQFTLPGISSIYYGDEVGLGGFRDPYCRMAYPCGREDIEILDFYREIAKSKNIFKDDFLSPFKTFALNRGLYAFERGNLICVINVGEEMQYLKAENNGILFSYGAYKLFEHGIDMYPESVAILKKA